jgi:ketosteroid isomerase-like protein
VTERNVEIVKRLHEVFNRGDLGGLIEGYAEDAEFVDRERAPDQPTVVSGRAAIRKVIELWTAELDDFRCDVDEYVDVGDAVICSAHWYGRGKASGIPVDVRQFDVYELANGQVIRATLGCRTKDEALKVLEARSS